MTCGLRLPPALSHRVQVSMAHAAVSPRVYTYPRPSLYHSPSNTILGASSPLLPLKYSLPAPRGPNPTHKRAVQRTLPRRRRGRQRVCAQPLQCIRIWSVRQGSKDREARVELVRQAQSVVCGALSPTSPCARARPMPSCGLCTLRPEVASPCPTTARRSASLAPPAT